jgi:hypothetical protein
MWFDTMMYGVILSQFVKWCSHYGRSERKPTRYLVVRLSAHLERRELKGMVIVVADDSYYRILHLVCSYPPSPPWYGTDIEELSIMILMRHIFAVNFGTYSAILDATWPCMLVILQITIVVPAQVGSVSAMIPSTDLINRDQSFYIHRAYKLSGDSKLLLGWLLFLL